MQKYCVVVWLLQYNFFYGVVFFCDGFIYDLLCQKVMFLQSLVQEVELNIVVGYGFFKDVVVYVVLGLFLSQIYIVGCVVWKLQVQCQFLLDGYVVYLGQLEVGLYLYVFLGFLRVVLGKSSYGVVVFVDFLCKQSQLFCLRGFSQVECEGLGILFIILVWGKVWSISLKLDSEE